MKENKACKNAHGSIPCAFLYLNWCLFYKRLLLLRKIANMRRSAKVLTDLTSAPLRPYTLLSAGASEPPRAFALRGLTYAVS